jgi:FixJ family two-component response regulator
MSNGTSVLVVDADLSARNGLARLLRAGGYVVCGVSSAEEFQDALDASPPGCVVLDVDMAGLSSRRLRAKPQTHDGYPLTIVIAADDDLESKHRAEQMNAIGFFRKPVDGVALLDAIDWALRSNTTGGNYK